MLGVILRWMTTELDECVNFCCLVRRFLHFHVNFLLSRQLSCLDGGQTQAPRAK